MPVPQDGLAARMAAVDHIRPATIQDVPKMAELEMEVGGIVRERDYRYFIENRLGFWHVSAYENAAGGIDGWLVSCEHPAFNMLGPCVAKSENEAVPLIFCELNQHKGRSPVLLAPMQRPKLVRRITIGALAIVSCISASSAASSSHFRVSACPRSSRKADDRITISTLVLLGRPPIYCMPKLQLHFVLDTEEVELHNENIYPKVVARQANLSLRDGGG